MKQLAEDERKAQKALGETLKADRDRLVLLRKVHERAKEAILWYPLNKEETEKGTLYNGKPLPYKGDLLYPRKFFPQCLGVKINLYGAHWAAEWNNNHAKDVVKIATQITGNNFYTKEELWDLIEKKITDPNFFD